MEYDYRGPKKKSNNIENINAKNARNSNYLSPQSTREITEPSGLQGSTAIGGSRYRFESHRAEIRAITGRFQLYAFFRSTGSRLSCYS